MSLLDVSLHLQDSLGLCGPACAQMVSRFFECPLTQQDVSQLRHDNDSWYTTPTQLEKLINVLCAHHGSVQPPPFTTTASTTFAAAMARIMAGLNAGFPAVVLISGGEHWVVVRGVTGGGSSRFVHVRDPFPERDAVPGATHPLPEHADGDGCDEAAELMGLEPNRRGLSDQVIRWNEWKSNYFFPCGMNTDDWRGKRIAIVADLKHEPAPEPEVIPLSLPTHLLSDSVAVEWARKALIDSELATEAGWADAIHDQVLNAQARALRVERLDGGAPYFLVVLTDADGRGVVAQLDASTGELIGARLMARRLARSLLAPVPAGHRRFVWQPTSNSFYSPYFPFSEISQASGPPVFQRTFDQRKFDDLRQPPDQHHR